MSKWPFGGNFSGNERGFGILESVIALSIIFMLILTLVRTFDTSVTVVTQTGRRAAANALASELLERSRSLEWEHMGLTSNANGSTCPDDVGCSTLPASVKDQISTNAAGNYTFEGEEIVFANGATFDPFLSFTDTMVRAGAEYQRFLFVTSVRDDPADAATERARRITAVVRWEAPSGLPEETRLATLVTEFTEPSQPYIHGEMDFDGGVFSLRGSESRCGGATDCGAYAPGSAAWVGSQPARDDFTADVFLSDAFASATSDYVSGAISLASGASADIRWAGPDGLLGTADDVITSVEEPQVLIVVDDDASSLPPADEPFVTPVAPSPTFNASGAAPFDIVVADLQDDADLNLSSEPDLDDGLVAGEAWTEHDLDPGPDVVDALPYAAITADSAETTRVGFVEYADTATRSYYETLLGQSLNEASYEFTLARAGDDASGPGLAYDGNVDRFDDVSGNRQIIDTATWAGEVLWLLGDTIQSEVPSRSGFKGWVIVELPTLATSGSVQAGESAAMNPSLTVVSDLRIRFWDAGTGKYVVAYSGYGSQACDSSVGVSFTGEPTIGGPQTYTVNLSSHPKVRFEVDADFTVRRFCPGYQLDSNMNVASSFVQSQGFLTGTLTYRVVDELVELVTGDGVLFDLELDVDAGGLDSTALFFDPEA